MGENTTKAESLPDRTPYEAELANLDRLRKEVATRLFHEQNFSYGAIADLTWRDADRLRRVSIDLFASLHELWIAERRHGAANPNGYVIRRRQHASDPVVRANWIRFLLRSR